MSKSRTIAINGVFYDAHTGMRIAEAETPERAPAHSQTLHKKHARTQTLKRGHVKAPHAIKIAVAGAAPAKKPRVTRSPHIQKFAKDEPAAASPTPRTMNDVAPTKHPLQHKAAAHVATKKAAHSQAQHSAVAPTPQPAHEIKRQAVEKALVNAQPAKKEKKQSFVKRHPRLVSISSASLAIALLGGYLTYLNLPNISVRVAAAQAGIAASYPSYQPSGYSLRGPVAYSNGQVSMNFGANVGPQDFTVNQTKSSWDSSALLENYVEAKSAGDYQTLTDGGLTIYAYDSGAAWVNGGVLHTINGSAPLSPDQIRRIATSM